MGTYTIHVKQHSGGYVEAVLVQLRLMGKITYDEKEKDYFVVSLIDQEVYLQYFHCLCYLKATDYCYLYYDDKKCNVRSIFKLKNISRADILLTTMGPHEVALFNFLYMKGDCEINRKEASILFGYNEEQIEEIVNVAKKVLLQGGAL